MPNDVLLLLEGLAESPGLRHLVRDWKQRTTLECRNTVGGEFWQRGHVDHVLQPNEDTNFVIRYALETPAHAELVAHVREYRYAGSDTAVTDGSLLRATGA